MECRPSVWVYPLHGLYWSDADQRWVAVDAFDPTRSGLKLKKWLRQRLLQVEDRRFTIQEVLREVVNTQGAHVDLAKDDINQLLRSRFCSKYMNLFAAATGRLILKTVRESPSVVRACEAAQPGFERLLKDEITDRGLWFSTGSFTFGDVLHLSSTHPQRFIVRAADPQ